MGFLGGNQALEMRAGVRKDAHSLFNCRSSSVPSEVGFEEAGGAGQGRAAGVLQTRGGQASFTHMACLQMRPHTREGGISNPMGRWLGMKYKGGICDKGHSSCLLGKPPLPAPRGGDVSSQLRS